MASRTHARWATTLGVLLAGGLIACPAAPPRTTEEIPRTPAEPGPAEAVPDPAPVPPDDVREEPVKVTQAVPPPSPGARIEDEQNSISVFRAAAPATVYVTNKQIVRDRWSMKALEVPAGTGSGFIWDTKGHVVTNAHVVANGRSFEITDKAGKSYPAKLVGGDPNHDIAVLKVDLPPDQLTAIRLPPAEYEPEVGQKTLAIGNPFGLDQTLTVGVISALGREITGYGGVTIAGMIQTDASINPGNSGGPLLNSSGELIGMNTMIYSKTGSSAGIGFAVPVSEIRRIVPQIIEHGAPIRAGLGIVRAPDELARANRIVGVVVERVVPNSPAARAGIEGIRQTRAGRYVGDVIVGIDGLEVKRWDDLYKVLDSKRPGDKVALRVDRDGATREVPVELYELKPEP